MLSGLLTCSINPHKMGIMYDFKPKVEQQCYGCREAECLGEEGRGRAGKERVSSNLQLLAILLNLCMLFRSFERELFMMYALLYTICYIL